MYEYFNFGFRVNVPATGVSDEYMKKLQEWEELKTRRTLSSQKGKLLL